METEHKQKQLYQSFSHYKTLSEADKVVFWEKRKVFIDSLTVEEKQQSEDATWSNINDIKTHLLQIGEKIKALTPQIIESNLFPK